MIKVALVGNIASGKSTVECILSKSGFHVLDTDTVAHNLLTDNKQVLETFKNFDILENCKISREKLGKVVFSDSELKKKLEDILYPSIREEIKKFFEYYQSEKFVFVAIPLLFEAGMEDLFDKVLFIYTDDNIRLERLIKRNNYNMQYAKTRIDSQMNQDIKVKKSDWVIYNNSTIKDLEQEVIKLIEQIR